VATTPEPTETVPLDSFPVDQWPAVAALVIGMAMVMLAAVIVTFAVLRASKYPPPTALITALSILTLFAVAGGIASRNDEAWTIAAAGIGALAGSVTSMFQAGRPIPETVEKAVAVVQELEKQEVMEQIEEAEDDGHSEDRQ
jgi:hypothetical protein